MHTKLSLFYRNTNTDLELECHEVNVIKAWYSVISRTKINSLVFLTV